MTGRSGWDDGMALMTKHCHWLFPRPSAAETPRVPRAPSRASGGSCARMCAGHRDYSFERPSALPPRAASANVLAQPVACDLFPLNLLPRHGQLSAETLEGAFT